MHTEIESEMVAQDEEERRILVQHRQKKAEQRAKEAQRIKYLELALGYEKWLQANNSVGSFSDFINGYLEGITADLPDIHMTVYTNVELIREQLPYNV